MNMQIFGQILGIIIVTVTVLYAFIRCQKIDKKQNKLL